MSNARTFIADLAAQGRYHFAIADARASLGVSQAAAKLALLRLGKQGLIASPARGFYIIVPPEYKRLGCLPADQFIPQDMPSPAPGPNRSARQASCPFSNKAQSSRRRFRSSQVRRRRA